MRALRRLTMRAPRSLHRAHPQRRPLRRRTLELIAAVGVVLALAVALAPPTPPTRTHDGLEAWQTVTFAAVGDSLTAGYAGVEGWPVYAVGPKVLMNAGWFEVGLRSDQIVIAAIARGIPNADLLVIMGCTNDIIAGRDYLICLNNWDLLADTMALPVLAAAAAPSNGFPAETLGYNAALAQHAADRGWAFVDPWVGVRASDGTYLPGMQRDASVDPWHPNAIAAELVGNAMSVAIYALGCQVHDETPPTPTS